MLGVIYIKSLVQDYSNSIFTVYLMEKSYFLKKYMSNIS